MHQIWLPDLMADHLNRSGQPAAIDMHVCDIHVKEKNKHINKINPPNNEGYLEAKGYSNPRKHL